MQKFYQTMKLRKRGLQRIADKIGKRDHDTALQRSITFFPVFSTHHLLLETRVSQYPLLYLSFCNDEIQKELHSFHYSSGLYEGRTGQAENSLLGIFSTTKRVDSLERGEGEKKSELWPPSSITSYHIYLQGQILILIIFIMKNQKFTILISLPPVIICQQLQIMNILEISQRRGWKMSSWPNCSSSFNTSYI